ncbi:MAG: hypothetical protein ACXABO_20250 [Promethearchaeota archaeon]
MTQDKKFKISPKREGIFLLVLIIGEFFLFQYGIVNIPLTYGIANWQDFYVYLTIIIVSVILSCSSFTKVTLRETIPSLFELIRREWVYGKKIVVSLKTYFPPHYYLS